MAHCIAALLPAGGNQHAEAWFATAQSTRAPNPVSAFGRPQSAVTRSNRSQKNRQTKSSPAQRTKAEKRPPKPPVSDKTKADVSVSTIDKSDKRAVVAEVQKRYDNAQTFVATFKQTLVNAIFDRSTSSGGQIRLKKPGRMRWDYEKPEPRMYVSNGKTLWMYEPADNQALKQDLAGSQLPAALSFLMGTGKLTDEFDIEIIDKLSFATPADIKLSLKPKTPQTAYKYMYFVVDPNTFLVRQTILIDPQGNVNNIVFTDIKTDQKLPDKVFNWRPPKGTRVVDAKKLQ